jgi:glycosyltransferase involved in cell wall biosynthesis
MLAPAVTCLLTAHRKPYLRDAIESVLGQTRRRDVELVVVDSGSWIDERDVIARQMADVHADFAELPGITWVFTGEGAELRREACPVAWATNQAIRAGLVRGRYMCTFYDDDRYHPTFFERMAGFLDDHPEAPAVWCSQNRIRLDPDGSEHLVGVIAATGPKSAGWDCQVDGGQIMWRASLLDLLGDPWIPEGVADCRHSDGLFLEKLGAVASTVPAIGDVLMDHRFTPISTYTPSPS